MGLTPFDNALKTVIEATPGPEPEVVPWLEAEGRVLLQPAVAAWDEPLFDRSAMDGYAVGASEASAGGWLKLMETVEAGGMPSRGVGHGECSKVMTGAPIPEGADAVVPVEEAEAGPLGVRAAASVRQGQHIRVKGEYARAGEALFQGGRRLDGLDIASGASLGVREAVVAKRVTARIVCTGGELVAPGETPGPGQIVDSNSLMLASLWRSWGGSVLSATRSADRRESLGAMLGAGLDADFLIVSGAVSEGDFDLVPALLEEAGAEILFHKVAMKPGKPVLFGLKGGCAILALPGNPVSSFVGAQLFLRAAIGKRCGLGPLPFRSLPLEEAHASPVRRRQFEPAAIVALGASRMARLLPHRGSADLPAWRWAQGIAELPESEEGLPAGRLVRFLKVRGESGGDCGGEGNRE